MIVTIVWLSNENGVACLNSRLTNCKRQMTVLMITVMTMTLQVTSEVTVTPSTSNAIAMSQL